MPALGALPWAAAGVILASDNGHMAPTMSVYLIAEITMTDRERYREYEAGFMEIFAKFDGRMLAVDEAPEILEGDWPATRTVLIEFPSAEAAHAWYDSDAYQNLARHRFSASRGNVILIQGLPT